MKITNKRIAAAAAHVWAERWNNLDGIELLSDVLSGPFRGKVAALTSFGAESAVLLDMVAEIDKATPVIFIDSGMLFKETLNYCDQLTSHLGLSDVRIIKPNKISVNNTDPDGDLHLSHPDVCCNIRKIIPYEEAASGFDVIISGRKKFHGGERFNLKTAERNGRKIKINPLANFSENAIEETFILKQLPRHPLLDDGYRSIGCSACTRKINPGESVRAGRWCGQEKTECGIHRINNKTPRHEIKQQNNANWR